MPNGIDLDRQTAKKEKTDRNVTDLVENTRKILENNEKSNCMK